MVKKNQLIRELDKFDPGKRSFEFFLKAGLWNYLVSPLFESRYCFSALRVLLLKFFGAQVSPGIVIKSKVSILFPWFLSIGCNSWIGEGVCIINHERVTIGDSVCISQKAMIIASGHDFKSPNFKYRHNQIQIMRGVWVCAGAIVLHGSEIGENSVISAGVTVSGNIAPMSVVKNSLIIVNGY